MALQMTNLTLTDRQTDDKNRDHTHTTTDEWHFRRRTNRDRQTDGPHTDHNPHMALQMTNLTLTDRQTDDKNRDHTHTTTDEWHFRRRTNRDRQTTHILQPMHGTSDDELNSDRQTDGPHTYHNPCMAFHMPNITLTNRQTDDTDRQTDHTQTTTHTWHFR